MFLTVAPVSFNLMLSSLQVFLELLTLKFMKKSKIKTNKQTGASASSQVFSFALISLIEPTKQNEFIIFNRKDSNNSVTK